MPIIAGHNISTIFATKQLIQMANSYFRFKQFTVRQDRCSMKVGTDGVLLGAWADADNPLTILDVGTGTGLIALMLAQRFPSAQVDAIDMDRSAYEQAAENVTDSPFFNQIQVFYSSFQDFSELYKDKRYDLIVSNPPFFNDSLKSPDPSRTLARHTDTLPLPVLLKLATALLNESGILSLILPFDTADDLLDEALAVGLKLVRRTDIIPVIGGKPKRSLLTFAQTSSASPVLEQLTIELARHVYTEEFRRLTADFYLKH